jgi:hypothetical protein
MKFGIITPVFEGCYESIELLSREILNQTHRDWIWMISSNGFSKIYSQFAKEMNESTRYRRSKLGYIYDFLFDRNQNLSDDNQKIIYHFIEKEEPKDTITLLENICKRRNQCIKEIECDYIFCIDADAKLLGNNVFWKINNTLEVYPRSICIFKIIHEVGILPSFPLELGKIDLLNYVMKTSLAKEIGYPTKIRRDSIGNDFWFIKEALEVSKNDLVFIDEILAQHNGNNRYNNMCNILHSEGF